ncbi:MAG TPA: hypothetical protein VFE52_04875 [Devosia sp.]|jgi:hypothetical protein|nr:hypothetical protein [Devosia sp.]
MLLRILIFALIIGAIWLGVRRIWRDWQKQFQAEEKEVRQRDLQERQRPDVITLERDKDGTFRPPDDRRR